MSVKSHSSSGIEVHSRSFDALQLASFDTIGHISGSKCNARINILDCTGRYRTYKDRKLNFNSKVFLFKTSSEEKVVVSVAEMMNPGLFSDFEIHLCPGNQVHVERIGFDKISEFHPDKKNKTIKLQVERSSVTVEFFHLHDFDIFKKYLQMYEIILREEREKRESEKNSTQKPIVRSDEAPVVRKKKRRTWPTKGKFSVGRIFGSKKGNDFTELPYSQWEYLQVKKWFESTFYQESDSEPVTSFLYRLKKAKVLSGIEAFLRDHTLVDLKKRIEEGEGFPPRPKNTKSKKKSKKKKDEDDDKAGDEVDDDDEEEGSGDNSDDTLSAEKKIKRFPKIERKLLQLFEELEVFGGYFPYPYYHLVKKILSGQKEKQRDMTLREIERKLKFKNIHLWHVDECRDEILIMLLFNTTLKFFIRQQESEFQDFLTKYLRNKRIESANMNKKEEEDEGEEEDEEEEKEKKLLSIEEIAKEIEEIDGEEVEEEKKNETSTPENRRRILNLDVSFRYDWEKIDIHEVDPFLFEEVLIEFNKSKKYRLEYLSFKFYRLVVKIHEIQKRAIGIENEIKNHQEAKTRIKNEMDIIDRRINETSEKLSDITEKILNVLSGEQSENTSNILSLLENQTRTLDETLKVGEQQKSEKRKEIQVLEKEIQACQARREALREEVKELREDPDRKRVMKFRYLYSSERRETIERIVKTRILELNTVMKVRTFELVVKLILSKLSIHKPTGFQKTAMNIIDPIFKPKFFQWGFLHSSFSVKNVQFHWFSHSLVEMTEISSNDNYEDICAIDCDCPIICDFSSLNAKIKHLARMIVFWNLEMNYAPYSVGSIIGKSSKNKKNCQEFILEMLDILDTPTFYPEIEKYLSDLKIIVKHQSKHRKEKNKKKSNVLTTPENEEAELSKKKKKKGSNNDNYKKQKKKREKKTKKKKKKKETGIPLEFRFLRVDDSRFYQKFEDAFRNARIRFEKKAPVGKFGCAFFQTHKEVDDFIIECQKIDRDFHITHSGIYSLLKGFDRAFHMLKRKSDMFDDLCIPSEKGCPFAKLHAMHMLEREKKRFLKNSERKNERNESMY